MSGNEEHMRSILMYCSAEENLFNKLEKLNHWSLKTVELHGLNNTKVLEKGETQVFLHQIAPNVIRTSSIIPQDLQAQHLDFSADVLQSLSKALEEGEVSHVLDISDSDIKKLTT